MIPAQGQSSCGSFICLTLQCFSILEFSKDALELTKQQEISTQLEHQKKIKVGCLV